MQASDVLLIEPRGFGVNTETAASNVFQSEHDGVGVEDKALVEHRRLVLELRSAGVRTTVLQPHRDDIPDAVFPNNWFSTDPEGHLVIYPMEVESRRREIRPDIESELHTAGYDVREIVNLAADAEYGQALEGTGSMVLDHVDRVAYAARSSRTCEVLVDEWCERFGYTPCVFDAADPGGKPVYHTNVIMGVGSSLALVCLDAIPGAEKVVDLLEQSGREVLNISWEQVKQFAGNVLFLRGNDQEVMMISQTGWNSLNRQQRERVSQHAKPVPVAVDTIESIGGGSVRCMIAEIFLPRR
jgi:hypothetical protein